MSKQKRQQALLELISEYEIDTQEELTRRLQALGFETTQATVSRDIRELKLEKIACEGGHRYATGLEPETGTHASYQHVLTSCITSIDAAQNIIVVKTVSGMAMAVGAAIDHLSIDGILGCIAGDDTLFLAIRDEHQAAGIIGDIKNVVDNAH